MEKKLNYDIYFESRRIVEKFKKPVIIDGEFFKSYAEAAKKYKTATSAITYGVKRGIFRGLKIEKVNKNIVKQNDID